MQVENTKNSGSEAVVEYTDKPVSGWGGLISIARFAAALGLRETLEAVLPDGRTSNNQRSVVDIAVQLLGTSFTGGTRFEHAERARFDEVMRVAFGVKKFASASVITRYFGNFFQSQTEHLQSVLMKRTFALMNTASDILDLDSTVLTRYGMQEGSSKGYNPQKPGAVSHHPLLAMFARAKLIAHVWLRAGAASPHRGVRQFMCELLSQLPDGFRIEAVRADSGFYSSDFLSLLEERKLGYVIAARMSQRLKAWCAARSGWRSVGKEIEIAEGQYAQAKELGCARRMIVIRQAIRRQTEGVLFELVKYEYQAFATSLTDSSEDIWKLYHGRGDCENRIKELKGDFGAGGFCLNSFSGTEAVLRLICFGFNLMSLFKSQVLEDSKTTLGTIRHKVFVVGAIVGCSGRKTVLRLGLTGRWLREFESLLRRIQLLATSTAAQLREYLQNPPQERPSRWRLRKTPVLSFLPN